MRRAITFLAALAALACSSGKGTTGDDTGSGDDTGDSGDSGNDGVSPTIESADAWCYQHTVGDKFYQWIAVAEADDPQGVDTLESLAMEGVTVLQGDAVVAIYPLTCDQAGSCLTTWKENDDGISCSNATSYTIQIVVQDEDGNTSNVAEVTGRQGTDASGR